METDSDPAGAWYVSTGRLPPAELVTSLLTEAHERYRGGTDGERSDVYPALAAAPASLFGICVAGIRGEIHAIGDTDHEFSIMSIAKPFVFALMCHALGAGAVRRKIGVNGTGLRFNSLEAIERVEDGRTNPMVNPGAIATTSLAPGANAEAKWQFIHDGLSCFAGRDLRLDEDMYASASSSNHTNRSIAWLLRSRDRIYCDPAEAIELYTMQSCLNVTATDLAAMGAGLADGGINPFTRERVVDPLACHCTLAAMATAGLYETSGDWLYEIGLPGKSGISGGIVTVSPGKGGLATFAPLLDRAGNSVKGQLVSRFLSQRLGLDLFISQAAT